jgi:hypothetical protein
MSQMERITDESGKDYYSVEFVEWIGRDVVIIYWKSNKWTVIETKKEFDSINDLFEYWVQNIFKK